jgi:hypothetical protein
MKMCRCVAPIIPICAPLLVRHSALAQFSRQVPKLVEASAMVNAGQATEGITAIVGDPC